MLVVENKAKMGHRERRSDIHWQIRDMLGRDLTASAWQIIDDHLDKIGYLEYFLSLGGDPWCYFCLNFPRHSENVQLCVECDKGRPLEKDVAIEFQKYMDIIFPLLYSEE